MTAVLDASALILAGLPEGAPESLVLETCRRRHELVAPALLASETGQVVHRKLAKVFGPTPETRVAAHQHLLAGIRLESSNEAHRMLAGHIASRYGLSFYDAEYVALAVAQDALLLTEDKAMLLAARKELGAARALDFEGLRKSLAAGAA